MHNGFGVDKSTQDKRLAISCKPALGAADWLFATIRGIYTIQGMARHEFQGHHPTGCQR
jgi:hypothetical protein